MFKHSVRIIILASSLSLSAQVLPVLAQRSVTPPASPTAPGIANPCPLEQTLYEVGAIAYVAVLNCQRAMSKQTPNERSIAQLHGCNRYQKLNQAGAVSAQAVAEACGTATRLKPTVAPKLTPAQAEEELAQLNEICLRLKVLADEGAVPRIELLNAITRYSETLQQLGQTPDVTADSACRTMALK
jgi:hypothetical protein